MTREETRKIREQALEDTDLTANARLLLSLIIDWHHKEKGCVMHDSTMAEKLGISDRTVMRRRQELREAGYLREVDGAHRRELVPQAPRTGVMPGDTRGETPDTGDTQGGDTDVTGRETDNPEGMSSAPPCESAPPREEGVDENTDAPEDDPADDPEGAPEDAPVPIEKAIEIGEMVGVSERLCREWWLYYDEKGWPRDVKKVSSALRRWKMNDEKFSQDSGGGGDGALPGGRGHTEQFGDQDVVHFGQQ